MSDSDSIWTYLQGALSNEARSAFESRLETDRVFREQFKEAQWLNQRMTLRYAAEELDEEKLIDRIEQELMQSESSDALSKDRAASSGAPSVLPLPGRSPEAKGLVALAACLLIFLGVYPYPSGKIVSFRLDQTERLFRSHPSSLPDSALPPEQHYYTDRQLLEIAGGLNEVLTKKIAQNIRKPGYEILLGGTDEYEVTMTLDEMRSGQLFLHMSIAEHDTPDKPIRWEGYFKSLHSCQTSIDKTTNEILTLLLR